jgi:hypothetical protein
MDPMLGSRETLSPNPSEVESLDAFGDEDDVNEEGSALGPSSTDLGDSRTLNFVGATIRDASYPGDGGGKALRAGARRQLRSGRYRAAARARTRSAPPFRARHARRGCYGDYWRGCGARPAPLVAPPTPPGR